MIAPKRKREIMQSMMKAISNLVHDAPREHAEFARSIYEQARRLYESPSTDYRRMAKYKNALLSLQIQRSLADEMDP